MSRHRRAPARHLASLNAPSGQQHPVDALTPEAGPQTTPEPASTLYIIV
ncbi:MAG: hypothetical protein V6Z81_07155 [Parvularculales bacterium]